jgi:thiamine biosynthesis protein ThiS
MMIRVNGKKHSWHEGMTIKDILKDLSDSHLYAVVRINDKHVSRPHFEKTLVPDNSKVFLIPMIAGG